MPCDGSYMNPNRREEDSKKMAGMLVFLDQNDYLKMSVVSKHFPGDLDGMLTIYKSALAYYGGVGFHDEFAAILCENLKEVPDSFIYDGTRKENREIADWWDEHKEADAKRELKEAKARIKAKVRLGLQEHISNNWNEIVLPIIEKNSGWIPNDELIFDYKIDVEYKDE